MEVSLENETVFGLSVVASSTCVFLLLSKFVESFCTPTSHLKKDASWKWKNTLVSFVHSFITGIWSVLCFYWNPKMAEDLISTYSTSSHCLAAVSLGYFIADMIDMLMNRRTRQSYELILHHCVIVVCFGIAVASQRYVGYALVALLVELNSIFLHLRMLLQLLGFPKDDPVYRFNSLINLGTYVAFRITTLSWMTRWIVVNRDLVPLLTYTVGSVGLAIVTLMNIILFYRILRSDFIRKKDCRNKPE